MPSLSDNDVNLDNDALNVCFNLQVPPPMMIYKYSSPCSCGVFYLPGNLPVEGVMRDL